MKHNMPTLYSFVRCPYAMRARLALAFCGIDYVHREVDLKDKPKHMLSISPKGTVPILFWEDGRVLEESVDIVQWATSFYKPDNWADNMSVQEEGPLMDIFATLGTHFIPHVTRVKYPDRFPDAETTEEKALLKRFLIEWDKNIQGDFSMASKPSFIDLVAVPSIRQLLVCEPEWFAQNAPKHTQAWLAHWTSGDKFADVMLKRPIWESGREPLIVHNT